MSVKHGCFAILQSNNCGVLYLTARRCFYIQKTLLQNNKKTVVMLANVFDITSCFRLSLPCGGRLISVIHIRSMEKISTHALRGEGDLCVIARDKFKLAFQSTPPVGRATGIAAEAFAVDVPFQSTPSVGRATMCNIRADLCSAHFNPRPPWGGRRWSRTLSPATPSFQSTPSVGRATVRR